MMEANLDYLFTYFLIYSFSFCFEALRMQAHNRSESAILEVQKQNQQIFDAQKEREAIEDRLVNHESFKEFRYSVQTHENERIYLSTRGEPQFNEAGEFTGYTGSGTEITEYEKSQIALREQETRHHSITRSDPSLVHQVWIYLYTPIETQAPRL